MKHFASLAAAAATLALSAPAHAAPPVTTGQSYNFNVTGGWTANFNVTLPIIMSDFSNGSYFTIQEVPGFPGTTTGNADIIFWSGPLGGLTVFDFFAPGTPLLDATGAQLYTGPEYAPALTPGTYALNQYGGTGTYSLTITALAVPEPATWAMMIGGFGLIGGLMRRQRVRVSYAA